MPFFLLTVLSIYSAVHVYTFFKVKAAFPFGLRKGILLGIFFALMECSLILIRILVRYGYDSPARVLAYIGYCWMGVLFLFFTLSILTDLYCLSLKVISQVFHKDMTSLIPSAKQILLIPLFLGLSCSLYGYFEALNIRPVHITIRSSKIPEAVGHLRIVQITDVHMGLIVQEDRIRRMIKVIQEAHPDILISTGDFVDGQIDNLAGFADLFKVIKPRYGKYAITGNHEFHAGIAEGIEINRRAGFTMLRDQAVTVVGLINIAGVDYASGSHSGKSDRKILSKLPLDKFTILLKHAPVVDQSALGFYDLQLSGHTHGGQIFPFRLIIRIFNPYVSGWYNLPYGSHLYVSKGTGTWGAPIRFLTPPEVTVIDLIHDNQLRPKTHS
jgi:predicted MPP superfamily phosphohydrolase